MLRLKGERRPLRLLSFVFVLTWIGWPAFVLARDEHKANPAASTQIQNFLKRHWSRPLAAQGAPPQNFTQLEANLSPAACGACHSSQFSDWRNSLHGHAMGPGLVGQLAEMAANDRANHQGCLRCHAPLKEQADSLVQALSEGTLNAGSDTARASMSAPLHEQGLVCAACHVRNYQWYGPPRKDGSTPKSNSQIPHRAWQVSKAYEDASFCSACHQFEPGQYALNGKLLENTYMEWLDSPYAEQGVTCQSCHMPDRQHQWKGIHDPETVKSGVEVKINGVRIEQDQVKAHLEITNTGTGHRFPTYVTPKVFLEAVQLDVDGKELEATLWRYTIAREIPLDLSREVFDTRLAPNESVAFDYSLPLDDNATVLLTRLRVEPDAFYEKFFQSLLENGFANKGKHLIQQALAATRASHFTLFEQRHHLQSN